MRKSSTRENFSSKIADVNYDISKLNRKMTQSTSYQEHIESLIKEEAKLRQNIEKKTFLMNENFNDEITKLKTGFDKLSQTMLSHIESIKDEILVDVRNSNNKFLSTFETNIKRFDEYEKHLANSQDDKLLQIHELENKLNILEELTGNQFQIIKNEISSSNGKINQLQNQIVNNTQLMTNDISKIKEEVTIVKNEVEKMKINKGSVGEILNKITNDISSLSTKNEKLNHEMSLITKEVESKLKHYENVNKMLNETFMSIKNDVSIQIDDFNSNNNNSNAKLKENVMNEIKQCKLDMEKFNINIIEENQKFIDFSQSQLKSQNESVKQLFDYTNDDIDVLKKKCDTLENIIKNIRNEMLNNINNVEGFLTRRYDSIFRTMNSERSLS